jgi:glutamate-5-semialdehyde dehydrogenase
LLTKERIEAIAKEVEMVAQSKSPLGIKLSENKRPNGLLIQKISVPIGVISVIYESRPNVTIDVFALCFKSGNACVLKGGKEALYSNQYLVSLIHESLKEHQIDSHALYLLPPNREAMHSLLIATNYVDVCIPRGSQTLIDFVRDHAKIPVIETGAGIVHTYFDESGDLEKGKLIIHNAKTRRVSVCNALDTLIIHRNRISDLPSLVHLLANNQVEIFADEISFKALENAYPKNLLHKATLENFGHEFLDYKMSIKTVDSIDDAINHIQQFSSRHSEAIIAEEPLIISEFLARIDAAAVYVNASTAFTDGGQFGMGSEIGISTQKLHARGPMGLDALTSYKWIVLGNGQIRAQ